MHVILQSNGQSIEILAGDEINAGGEARIYALPSDPGQVAKVYREPKDETLRKLTLMLAKPPVDPTANQGHISIAWPSDILKTADGRGRLAGYLMPRASGTLPIIDFFNPGTRRVSAPLFSYLYLIRTARNLAAVVHALHQRDYVIGDMNESNILVSDTALVTVVDTDSFQVRDPATGAVFRCAVGKPEFTPRELQGKLLSYVDRSTAHDCFGLAVLIFQLLMEGVHPFAGIFTGDGDPPSYEERIAAGHFPYGTRQIPYRALPVAPHIEILPGPLRGLFTRCFQDGHESPQSRPSAQTWALALRDAEQDLLTCEVNDQHQYGNHLLACPWCARMVLLGGRDPFPSRSSVEATPHHEPAQTALPAIGVNIPILLPPNSRPLMVERTAPQQVQTMEHSARAANAAATSVPSARIQVTVSARDQVAPRRRNTSLGMAVAALVAAVCGIAFTFYHSKARGATSQPRIRPGSRTIKGAYSLDALVKAVKSDDTAQVGAILDAQPFLAHQTGKDAWTALHFAAYKGYAGLVGPLIDHGADVNAAEVGGYTPLHLAAQEGHGDVVRALIDRGADVNRQEKLGWSPLHFAVQEGHTAVVTDLIDDRADVNAVTKDGLTPLAVAEKEHRPEIAAILRQNGGQ